MMTSAVTIDQRYHLWQIAITAAPVSPRQWERRCADEGRRGDNPAVYVANELACKLI
jgi:hypothetical protein